MDADLCGYFDSIPHAELMKSVARRVSRPAHAASDQDVAGSAGGRDGRAGTHDSARRATGTGAGHAARAHRSRPCWPICTCAGSSWGGRQLGLEQRLRAQIVNYADDFVICCKRGAEEAWPAMRRDDGEAEADGQRGEDADLPRTGRALRLSGVHVRAVLLDQDGTSLYWHAAVEEERSSA